jgi:hypothetical protein
VILTRLIPAGVFLAIFVAHALYLGFSAASAPSGWNDFNMSANAAEPLGLRTYWRGQDYFMGFSYALGAAFAAWAFSRCISFRRGRIATGGAAVGGLTLVGALMAGGCFLIGCCGSPMLAVYVSLFGAKALGVGKPLTALVTLVSVGCGYWCLSRRPPERGACADACCSSAGTPQEIAGTNRSKAGKTQKQSSHDQRIARQGR